MDFLIEETKEKIKKEKRKNILIRKVESIEALIFLGNKASNF